MNKQIKKIPLSHFHLIKKATMDDFREISEWLKEAFENHKEFDDDSAVSVPHVAL